MVRGNTQKYLIGRPAEKRSLKVLEVDAKRLLERFLHGDSVGAEWLALGPHTAEYLRLVSKVMKLRMF